MTGFKSLGLAGAKQAFRSLLRRALPADEKVSNETSSSSTSPSSTPDHSEVRKSLPPPLPSSDQDHSTTTAIAPPPADTDSMASPLNVLVEQDPQRHDLRQGDGEDKENQPPAVNHLETITKQLDILTFNRRNGLSTKLSKPETQAEATDEPEHDMSMFNDPVIMAERAKHLGFIGEALDMARLALRTNETPVGCVLVHDGKVIARGMNATNVTRNGTRHAEFMALCALLSYPAVDGPITTSLKRSNLPNASKPRDPEESNNNNKMADAPLDGASENGSQSISSPSEQLFPDEGNEDGSKGHLYPYGQRLYPATQVTPQILQESILYVTVEPCVMCASLLRQVGIKKVYFGAVNDKFGGTGGVFSIHANSLPVGADNQTASAHPQPKPIQYPDGGGSLGTSFPEGGGDGGNVELGYEIEGGWGRDEAVGLLRRFYVQENGRAPIPRKKEGRAARLAAMMERDGVVTYSESTEEREEGEEEEEDHEREHEREHDHDDRDPNDDDEDDEDDSLCDDDDDDDDDDGDVDVDVEKENMDPQVSQSQGGKKMSQAGRSGKAAPDLKKDFS